MQSLANISSPSGPVRKKSAKLNFWLGVVFVGGLIVALFLFDPAAGGLYPICMFHRLTGLQCPGCGGLRATHQLLHGHVVRAFHLNPFFVAALIPAGLFLSARWLVFRIQNRPGGFELRPLWLGVGLGAAALFGILRNIF